MRNPVKVAAITVIHIHDTPVKIRANAKKPVLNLTIYFALLTRL
jgi:hypothetical protein